MATIKNFIKCISTIRYECYVCTERSKSLSANCYVWRQTTLITCSVGGEGVCQPTCKMGTFFPIPLAITEPILNNFQLNEASGQTIDSN